ncbi:hypothetical protein [Streptomyces sp. V3I7]|uniref:hypothetical protein n=1 Tax=Streptomyces sp. V3I7 TaxID=3042278 RepID=UPI0027812A1E|nr:hypothetical protein [Streptomyces sp. V3I7]MDQ0988866.1 hypothetical protein [Streptomyces sp. V3I7]
MAATATATPTPTAIVVVTADDRPRAHQVVVLVLEEMAVVEVCRRQLGTAARNRRDRLLRRGSWMMILVTLSAWALAVSL